MPTKWVKCDECGKGIVKGKERKASTGGMRDLLNVYSIIKGKVYGERDIFCEGCRRTMMNAREKVKREETAQPLDDGKSQVLDSGEAQALDGIGAQVLDGGGAQPLEGAQVLDGGGAQVLDDGEAQVLDGGGAQVLDGGEAQAFDDPEASSGQFDLTTNKVEKDKNRIRSATENGKNLVVDTQLSRLLQMPRLTPMPLQTPLPMLVAMPRLKPMPLRISFGTDVNCETRSERRSDSEHVSDSERRSDSVRRSDSERILDSEWRSEPKTGATDDLTTTMELEVQSSEIEILNESRNLQQNNNSQCSSLFNTSQDFQNMNVEAVYSESERSFSHSEPVVNPHRRKIYEPTTFQNKVFIPDCSSVGKTENQCCVCKNRQGRNAIPKSATLNLWCQNKIYLPPNCRSCQSHIEDGIFSEEAKSQLKEKSHQGTVLNANEIKEWIEGLTFATNRIIVNVDSEDFSDYEYELLLGVTREDFNDIYSTIGAHLRWSVNRSGRNALALFLCKMRLAVSQKLLAYMFDIRSQKKVSEIIFRVAELLDKYFVPNNYGYQHISREEILRAHTPEYISKLYNVPDGNISLYLDGTYFPVEKSSNHVVQKKSYSTHKRHNLLKAMMVVLPTGYVLEAAGMYYSDDYHNDAKILHHMLQRPNGISSLVQGEDNFVVDRGFRNVVEELTEMNAAIHLPNFLKRGQKSFNCQEANHSRKVTLTRWVVEAVNGRLKNVFKFFEQKIPNHYFNRDCDKKLGRFLRIACSIINKYHPPLFVENEKHQRILEQINIREAETNSLKEDLEKKGWLRKRVIWEHVTSEEVCDFPELSLDDLFEVTLGNYQIKNAKGYTDSHFKIHKSYKLTILKEELVLKEGFKLIKAHIKSRMRQQDAYDLWIEYPEIPGEKKVFRYYCRCMGGEKTIGCCSHVAGVLWFLGYRRGLEQEYVVRSFGDGILDATEAFGNVDNNMESEPEEEPDDIFGYGF